MKLNIFSDLRKPGLVPGKSLSLAQNYVFCFGESLIYIMSNRMRNLHIQLDREYDREIVKKFHQWEKYERKMADFSNHQRFTLRCLAEDLVPVSICLKQNIRTPKGLQIIRKAERALLNERVRSINNTLNMLKSLRDTCREELRKSAK